MTHCMGTQRLTQRGLCTETCPKLHTCSWMRVNAQEENIMRKLVFILAAAACLTTGAALTGDPASAQSVTIGVGNGSHWGDRDRDRWDRWGSRSHARSGVIIETDPRRCRNITVRTRLSNGDVVVRKTRRCS